MTGPRVAETPFDASDPKATIPPDAVHLPKLLAGDFVFFQRFGIPYEAAEQAARKVFATVGFEPEYRDIMILCRVVRQMDDATFAELRALVTKA